MTDRPDDPDEQLKSFRLSDTPGHLLRRWNQRSHEIFTELIGRDGPTRQQFALLITVYQRPGVTQSQLAAETGIDRVTLGDVLNRLVEKKWIERRRSQSDSRAYDVSLTAKGLKLLRQVTPLVVESQSKLLEPLPPEQRQGFLRCLQMLFERA
jgi:DNA-binding MarR family transcriptional regulator